ncbi:MAG TPA: hypothetical protein VFK13_13180 [Gemmatimonadaceae bacterium]|nr:hypothetical protein [Gemmatimonadaceae bacterium]
MSDDVTDYRHLDFMQSRIPALDALETFLPHGQDPDADMREIMARTGSNRWFPVDGGHRILILYEGGSFDPARYTLITGGWDHEHCSRCTATIQPMTLCWVTRAGEFVLLCTACHGEIFGTG